MTHEINETHDANLKSWVESANEPDTDFPIQNLPFCLAEIPDQSTNIWTRIGDYLLNLEGCERKGLLKHPRKEWYLSSTSETHDKIFELFEPYPFSINGTMKFDAAVRGYIRRRLVEVLREDADEETRRIVESCLVPVSEAEILMPAQIADYTDFYCSIFHATNVGAMFRPENPLLPNYKYVPIGYHGRASSIIVSGTDITRPKGQNRADAEKPPVYTACKNLDYEMEVGFFVGKSNELGETIPLKDAEEHIFGLCLLNDWSARDIQAWEYQPLGPFLAKSFATTISPFVVTMEALAPFRVPAFERDVDDPKPLDYLSDERNEKFGGIDIKLEVLIQTQKMRDENIEPFMISHSNMKDLYWTIAQMLTHHASNGCNLQTGDLIGTGTISGREKSERGCLLEMTWRGKEPVEFPNGETRRFLEDGDEVIMRGFCEREGFRRIGFGECRGIILPASE